MILREKSSSGALLAGGVAAVLASTCCLGPLVLVLLGFSGAWIGSLSVLEPYRPFFLTLTFVALAFAGVRIFRPAQDCAPGEVCSIPRVRLYQRIFFMVIALLALLAFVFPYLARFFY